jgi:tRNA(fMet)-specific endonuclease VapC
LSGIRYLLDTNICIHLRERRRPAVLRRFEALADGDAGFSVITYGELVYGAEHSSQRERAIAGIREILNLVPILDLPTKAADFYGIFRARFAAKGSMIGGNDLWIAAHAHAAGLILVTNNEREFRRIPELQIENWTNDPV